MYHFLMLQYRMHKITKAKLRTKVPEYITPEQYKAITGEDYEQ